MTLYVSRTCLRSLKSAYIDLEHLSTRPCSKRHSSHTSSSKKLNLSYQRTVFSGIQPTGIPHLGNYLGAIQNWLHLQNNSTKLPSIPSSQIRINPNLPPRIIFFIVGLHAITIPQDPVRLRRERKECLACLLACGLGGEKSTLFFQEEIQEHAELAWYLNTLTPVGRLERMTTWKSKLSIIQDDRNNQDSSVGMGDLKLGLLAYPVLQAADILLYKSTDIPVGEDQQQHLELARDVAMSFNRQFGETFPIPLPLISPSKRILSLTSPTEKMSKSAPNPLSRILITDSPSDIFNKIKSAVTDSERSITYDPVSRRGVSNLLSILAACEGGELNETPRTGEEIAEAMRKQGLTGHAELKLRVGEAVVEKLRRIREEYGRILGDVGYLRGESGRGRVVAKEIAGETIVEVRRKVGLDGI